MILIHLFGVLLGELIYRKMLQSYYKNSGGVGIPKSLQYYIKESQKSKFKTL